MRREMGEGGRQGNESWDKGGDGRGGKTRGRDWMRGGGMKIRSRLKSRGEGTGGVGGKRQGNES